MCASGHPASTAPGAANLPGTWPGGCLVASAGRSPPLCTERTPLGSGRWRKRAHATGNSLSGKQITGTFCGKDR